MKEFVSYKFSHMVNFETVGPSMSKEGSHLHVPTWSESLIYLRLLWLFVLGGVEEDDVNIA